jgi:hypothetical protein
MILTVSRKQINGHMLKLTIHERTERRITVNTSCEGRDRTLPVFLIHIFNEQLVYILFISFVIASGEAIIFYFE